MGVTAKVDGDVAEARMTAKVDGEVAEANHGGPLGSECSSISVALPHPQWLSCRMALGHSLGQAATCFEPCDRREPSSAIEGRYTYSFGCLRDEDEPESCGFSFQASQQTRNLCTARI